MIRGAAEVRWRSTRESNEVHDWMAGERKKQRKDDETMAQEMDEDEEATYIMQRPHERVQILAVETHLPAEMMLHRDGKPT
jgi:hypothetical protein